MTGPYPQRVVKNNFGEQTTNSFIVGSDEIDISFIVDSTNGNGLGIRSLKGSPLVSAVYMNTGATPAAGNPNPNAGYIMIKFAKAYTTYVHGDVGFVSPVSGTPINITSGLSVGQAYSIVSVGTSTAANWQAIGLPVGVTPAVGASFIATSASAGTGSGVVEIPLAAGSGIGSVEAIGDPNQTINAIGGGFLLVQCFAPTSSGSTVPKATAPAAGTVVAMRFTLA